MAFRSGRNADAGDGYLYHAYVSPENVNQRWYIIYIMYI